MFAFLTTLQSITAPVPPAADALHVDTSVRPAARKALHQWRDSNEAAQWRDGGDTSMITPVVREQLARARLFDEHADALWLYRAVTAHDGPGTAPVYLDAYRCEYAVCTSWVRDSATAMADARSLIQHGAKAVRVLCTHLPIAVRPNRVLADLSAVRAYGDAEPLSARSRRAVLLAPGTFPFVDAHDAPSLRTARQRFRTAFPDPVPELFENHERALHAQAMSDSE